MQLTKRAAGWTHRQGAPFDTEPVNWYLVEPLDDTVFIVGSFGGNTDEHWEITGRKGKYKTADEALAALQQEADEALALGYLRICSQRGF